MAGWLSPAIRVAAFFQKVTYPFGITDCWEWTGATRECRDSVYAAFGQDFAHRAGYEMLVGPIEPGMELDHLCRNTICVNPLHLESVTPEVNNQRRFVRRCPSGHSIVGWNAEECPNHRSGPYITCRICHLRAARASMLKRRQRTASEALAGGLS